ncbi:hypothetical protein YC2023_093773 [Brassica napus]
MAQPNWNRATQNIYPHILWGPNKLVQLIVSTRITSPQEVVMALESSETKIQERGK